MTKTTIDKYAEQNGRVFLSGTQALVRMMLDQSRRDEVRGLNTGGFVSGYRGSPLGHVDTQMWKAHSELQNRNIFFQPGVNEDMAATAVWGSQQLESFQGPTVDGVFGLWYGKGPGVDRSGDALRHANLAGTAPKGGVVMIAGDDPMGRSSSIQQQSEQVLAGLSIPTFSAATVQDIYDFGLIGWELSRYAGVWVAIKVVSDVAESWYPVAVDPSRITTKLPEDFEIQPPGVHIRWPDWTTDQDERLLTRCLPAVHAFARANRLNRTMMDGANRRLGIITHGKNYVDTLEALNDLGIDNDVAQSIGLSIYKVGLIWPLEPEGVREFANGLDEILIVEESRAFLEPQVKDALFNIAESQRPRVLGKRDLDNEEIFISHGELTPTTIATVIAAWLAPYHNSETMQNWVAFLQQTETQLQQRRNSVARSPYFCSGCPHSTSTRVPEGSVQLAGIGCHTLAMFMDRDVVGYPQMGGEGVAWVGASPFLDTPHTFVNVGDGTFYHSGSMAIRQAISAEVNVTYKILYNDAVAMTGGQPVDGPVSVPHITYDMWSEGAKRIAVVSSTPDKFNKSDFAPGTTLHHRDELETLQKELRQTEGVSIIVYEQTCATELRRRRKRGNIADPQRRVMINDRVCEGCGDCGVQSNCLSVQPLETEFGRKRTIDQSACNKDFSCLKGFCPSFVTVEGGKLAKRKAVETNEALFAGMPEPVTVETHGVYGILIAGIGGTGVVTLSSLLGAAARLENKTAQILDLTGLAQKFGAVYCHVKIADKVDDLRATRLSYGKADLMIGADIVTSANNEALCRLRSGSHAVVNEHETVTGAFTRDTEFHIPITDMKRTIQEFCGGSSAEFFDTTRLAADLTGNTIGANMLLLGFACQKGWLPVRPYSLEQAIEANGLAVAYNLEVFKLGRLLAHDPGKITAMSDERHTPRASEVKSESLRQAIDRRVTELAAYQDQSYAERYLKLVNETKTVEKAKAPGMNGLTEAVVRNYHKLLAYKDEYEVARLYAHPEFRKSLEDQFAGDYRLRFHLAPPLISRRDKETGHLIKREFGSWILTAFRFLAKLKGLRGTRWDIFAYSAERKNERQLIRDFEANIAEVLAGLTAENYDYAVKLANLPEQIRGFGHVKERAVAAAETERTRLLARYRSGDADIVEAA